MTHVYEIGRVVNWLQVSVTIGMLKSINEPILTDGRFWFEIVNSKVSYQLCNAMYGIVRLL